MLKKMKEAAHYKVKVGYKNSGHYNNQDLKTSKIKVNQEEMERQKKVQDELKSKKQMAEHENQAIHISKEVANQKNQANLPEVGLEHVLLSDHF